MYKYKNLLSRRSLSIISVPALCMSSVIVAEAATLKPNAAYNMTINPTGSCFAFGDCTSLVDNIPGGTIQISTTASTPDGLSGVTFTVNSYSMASYTGTPGGFFATFADGAYPDWAAVNTAGLFAVSGSSAGGDTSAMTGSVLADGEIEFMPVGRQGSAEFFAYLGVPLWNLDDAGLPVASPIDFGTGLTSKFTTESMSNRDPLDPAGAPSLTLTGSKLVDGVAPNTFDATIVSVSNVGSPWTGFVGTPYSEVYNLTISLVSADPYGVDDTVATPQATPIIIDVADDLFFNDIHAAGEALTLDSFTQPADPLSSVIDNGNGTLTYTPNPALIGPGADSFTYTVADAGLQTDTATVVINLTSGTPPVANDDAVTTDEDNAITFDPVAGAGTTAGVVDDTDVDTGTASLIIVSNTTATNGVVTRVLNDITYTPAANYNGPDSFTYTIEDPSGSQDSATVDITVVSVNDAPVCSDVALTTAIDVALAIDVTNDLLSTTSSPALCTDAEGDAITLAAFDATGSSGGTIVTDGGVPETLTYTPSAAFEGSDTFSFTATDGVDNAVPNTATVNVADPSLSNFTMLDKQGGTFGGTNDVEFEQTGPALTDETDTTINATMRSQGPHPFFGSPWFSHHVRVFAPGTYTFDTTCNKNDYDTGVTTCNRAFNNVDQTEQFLTVTVGPGQLGGHILFDYTTTEDIDVFMVWDLNAPWDDLGAAAPKNQLFTGDAGLPPDVSADWERVSTDGDGDGIVGVAMIDGSFIGFSANFNIGPGGTADALPPITSQVSDTSLDSSIFSINIWGLVVGLFSILGLRSYRKNK